MKRRLSGFGNVCEIQSRVIRPESLNALRECVRNAQHILATGAHQSYGDASLAPCVLDTSRLNRFLEFDADKGILCVEAGITLDDILQVIVPKGWFLPVTPGTKKVTMGGALASNVHGKNHHKAGGFKDSLVEMTLVLANGSIITCSQNRNKETFEATLGGMGLTGVIYSATFRLKKIKSAFMDVETVKCSNLHQVLKELKRLDKFYEYTVAWIDCFSNPTRGIVIAGNHSSRGGLQVHKHPKLNIPFKAPSIVLNRFTLKLFNSIYYALGRTRRSHEHYDSFFYPLDKVNHWNRLYGRRGFIQYQCVVPLEQDVELVLEKVRSFGIGSFLAVLKELKDERWGISFPQKGYTLALDFPFSKDAKKLTQELDKIVSSKGGRVYLTKDALLSKKMFERMYDVKEWKRVRNKVDKTKKFQSLLSKRLGI